ncbi:MAG: hypothetical protein V4611_04555 [Patescibacteria group bacterium]
MTKNVLDTKFEKLLDYYAIAVYLTYELLDSTLLERRIKVGNDPERINDLINQFVPSFASDIRQADSIKGAIQSVHTIDRYSGSALDIANAYFYELDTRGAEWEYSDLVDLFTEYKERAEKYLEQQRN